MKIDDKTSDDELVVRAMSELPYDSTSFTELMRRYKNKAYSKVVSMVENKQDAEDLTQDIFIKIFNNLPNFKRKASFSTWLYIVTVNTCLNHIEKKQRKPQWWLTEDLDEMQIVAKEEQEILYIMGQGVDKLDVRSCIENTLEDIGEKHHRVIKLRFLEELDYKAISQKLSLGLSATKMRLKRAREEFRKVFEAQCLGK